MIQKGFTRCEYDCCVYLKKVEHGSYLYLLLYVDDMLIAAEKKSDVDKVKLLLSKEFDMKDWCCKEDPWYDYYKGHEQESAVGESNEICGERVGKIQYDKC